MKLPPKAHVAVVDGERFLLLRNGSDAANPSLSALPEPALEQRGVGNDLDEAAHVAAVAGWLNDQVLKNKIDDLVIVADKRSLGELRGHYHKELENRLVGEVGKALTGRPVEEIQKAIEAA